ncbi:Protein CBG27330 [Caenorhabditis briggsae]|uniref:Protein CBG27330 n=1 Tax=Caenorhabditis briggsae TaxID=6238 RepID=B6IG62_CAEBR|nr:Protein CBG27330 [Caenorhabditis briggsae]CAR98892.1 Protein CBG27330 [Caenorhabditis briggsae]
MILSKGGGKQKEHPVSIKCLSIL